MKQSEYSETTSPWLHLNSIEMSSLTDGLVPIHIPAKHMIIESGQPNDSVYIVKKGRVAIFISNPDGQEKAVIIGQKGCILGESSAILGAPFYINVRAIVDVLVYCIPYDRFKEKIITDGSLAYLVLESYARKVRLLTSQIGMLSFDRPLNRVKKMLLWIVEAYGKETDNGYLLKIRHTHQNIADLTGLSRVSVANCFATLYKEGLLHKTGSDVYITDIELLRQSLDEFE